ncbi:MAG: ubiquinol-cytochrome C chaperone family protein [Bdellovibrionales bacterium]
MEAVNQARQPVFFQDLQVEDTLEGRFEMICLHTGLLMEWLYKNDRAPLAQALFDVMFVDIDRNLRESGVGDLAVPKRIKKMMKAFKGRAFAYQEGIKKDTLDDVITRNLGISDDTAIQTLKTYISTSYEHIKQVTWEEGIKAPSKLFIGIEYEQKSNRSSAA